MTEIWASPGPFLPRELWARTQQSAATLTALLREPTGKAFREGEALQCQCKIFQKVMSIIKISVGHSENAFYSNISLTLGMQPFFFQSWRVWKRWCTPDGGWLGGHKWISQRLCIVGFLSAFLDFHLVFFYPHLGTGPMLWGWINFNLITDKWGKQAHTSKPCHIM